MSLSECQHLLQTQVQGTGGAQVLDPVRKKWVTLTPEEHVRQLMIQFLWTQRGYPLRNMAVERSIQTTAGLRRYDLLVFGVNHQPWMVVECKEPAIPIDERALLQLLHYNSVLRCPYWLLSNGLIHVGAHVLRDGQSTEWLSSIPAYER